MSARDDEDTVAAPRQRERPAMAAISPLPPPEEIFADWLMSVPHDADIARAAWRQIEVIDRRASLHPDVQVLRTLLLSVAASGRWSKPVSNL